MKKFICANTENNIIFEDEYFTFTKTQRIGMNDTPLYGLTVKTKEGSPAYKHAVEIRLNPRGTSHYRDFNGEPITFQYSDTYVAHGMRSTMDTLDDTEEYIDVLEDAVDFARRVNEWLYRSPEYGYKR